MHSASASQYQRRRPARPCGRPHAQDAVVAAGPSHGLERDRPHDLRERQRQHREIDAGQPHHQAAEQQRRDARRDGRRHQPDHHGCGEVARQQAGRIGAHVEPCRMPEARHPARAHHEMQAGGEQHQHQRLRQHRQRVGAEHGRRTDRAGQGDGTQPAQRGHGRADHGDRPAAGPRLGLRAPQQAVRADRQHGRHDGEHQHQRGLRHQRQPEALQQRDQQRREVGAGQRTPGRRRPRPRTRR